MAITITQEPSGIYPAYNDSYIIFSCSTVSAQTYAEISVPQYTDRFRVYPDTNGNYLFNLKEVVKATFNADGFDDTVTTPVSLWGKSIDGTYTTQDVTFEVFNSGTSEVLTGTTYEFFKSVKQIDEQVYSNEAQILSTSQSKNGIDYSLTYWEGFPFTFDLQRITGTSEVVVVNNNSGLSGTTMTATTTGTFRIWIDKGSENWTSENELPLLDIVNALEIKVNNVFKTNLRVKRVASNCGVYLKWFNMDGGYSYFLFEEFFKDEIKSTPLNTIATNSFANVGSLVAPTKLGGLKGTQQYKLKALVDANERKVLESLFTSPSVQLYSEQTPFQDGEWYNVQINGDYSIATKRNKNEISFTIILPQLITQTL